MPPNTDHPCPCGTGLSYHQCCQPYLAGRRLPQTAEALMRSRYTAHAVADIDYLMATWLPSQRRHVERAQVAEWAEQSQWLQLQVIGTEAGTVHDSDGWVEFIATCHHRGKPCVHRERSHFRRRGQRWYYAEGEVAVESEVAAENNVAIADPVMDMPQQRKAGTAKTGRNAPCPCGSGRKYKRCCAANRS